MASSKFSHRRAKPFNRRQTSLSSLVDACFKILNLSAGNPNILPPVSSRKMVLPSTHTFKAVGSVVTGYLTAVDVIVFFLYFRRSWYI